MHWLQNLNKKTLTWVGLACAAIILISVNVISNTTLEKTKVDLTEQKLFTISDGTKSLLQKIDEPIHVKVYFSQLLGEAAPIYSKYFSRVRSLLQQYEDISSQKVVLEFIEPEPFSDAEDRAVAAGLQSIRINPEGDQGYFGLVAENSTDNRETIAFFNPEREQFLEYDLTKLINSLANPKKKVVGLVSGINLQGGFSPMGQRTPEWMILNQIRDFYEVKTLDSSLKTIPEDIDVLMLVQPTGLTDEALYAIDQYAVKGGQILAFVDPVAESSKLGQPGMAPPSGKPSLDRLFKSWGVKFDADKVAGDVAHARRVQFGGPRPVVTDYVAWLSFNKANLDNGDVLSGGIEKLNLASVGFLEKADETKVSFSPIIKTSRQATSINADEITTQPDAAKLLREYSPLDKQLTVAARVTGEINSAFPNGKPVAKKEDDDESKADESVSKSEPDDDGNEIAKPHVSAGKLNAIIVADTDMLHEQFWVSVQNFLGQQIMIPQAHNDAFVLNALDNLSGGEALASLRARGIDNRPFTLVENIRREAEQRFRQKEHDLVEKLKEAEKNLANLENKGSDNGTVILSEADKKAIEKFRLEMIAIRKELRDVKHALRKDIDSLNTTVRFANIAGMPLVIALFGLGIAFMSRRRRTSSR